MVVLRIAVGMLPALEMDTRYWVCLEGERYVVVAQYILSSRWYP